MSDARTRTVSWQDPMIGAEAARGMSGLDYLGAIIRGEVPAPPLALLLGITIVAAEAGRTAFTVEPGEHHYNPIGVVHGGLIATLLDSALGSAVHSTLPAGSGYTTLELKANFVRAVTRATPRLRCEGEAIHVGGRIATSQARVLDAEGKLYAHGTSTCLLLRG
jgi:uncharacterized protein (TIGR00369 family)